MYFKFSTHLKKENNNKRTTSDNKKNWQKTVHWQVLTRKTKQQKKRKMLENVSLASFMEKS